MEFVPQAEIDLTALRHNLGIARRVSAGAAVWAVIKADAYGHGMTQVASALGEADGLAVARVEEAVRLREAGIARPLLVLEGAFTVEELQLAARQNLQLVVHHEFQVKLLERTRVSSPLGLWIKIDTGMHRLGFSPERGREMLGRLVTAVALAGRPGWLSHLACADEPGHPHTEAQWQRFHALLQPGEPASLANSAAILSGMAGPREWIRPGIMLYGASPFPGETGVQRGLQPVMTLQARLIAVNRIGSGERVGYGGLYRCPRDMSVGVVGIGYGDGYPRQAPSGTPVLVNGQRVPLIGRVSMDMITLDLSLCPEARVGDPVVLWGRGLPVEEIAERAGTISYQLLCGVTARVARRYLGFQTENQGAVARHRRELG